MVQRAYTIQDVISQLNGDSLTNLVDVNPENVAQMITSDSAISLAVSPALGLFPRKPLGQWGTAVYGSFSW